MARPNLSLEHLALTLAALGTSAVITACAKSESAGAVRSDQTPTASAAAPPPPVEQKAEEKGREPSPATVAPTATATASAAASAVPAPQKRMKGTTGQASCGAGTCTAEMKKK